MSVTLDHVSAETARALIAGAAASGLSVDGYLKRLLGVVNNLSQTTRGGTVEEFIQAMESLAEKDFGASGFSVGTSHKSLLAVRTTHLCGRGLPSGIWPDF